MPTSFDGVQKMKPREEATLVAIEFKTVSFTAFCKEQKNEARVHKTFRFIQTKEAWRHALPVFDGVPAINYSYGICRLRIRAVIITVRLSGRGKPSTPPINQAL